MTKKIFRSFLLTTLLTLAVSMFFVFGILYQYFEEQLMNDLKSKVVFISHARARIILRGSEMSENALRLLLPTARSLPTPKRTPPKWKII